MASAGAAAAGQREKMHASGGAGGDVASAGACLKEAAALIAIVEKLQTPTSLTAALDVLVKAQLLQAGAW